MKQINNGGPAFPVIPPCDIEGAIASGFPYPDSGMTLRDYFAAKAMQSLVASWQNAHDVTYERLNATAEGSYMLADAMLAARQQGGEA
jgi:hypothetical protein